MKEKSEKKENAPTADADAGRTRKKPTNGTPSLIISLFYIIFFANPPIREPNADVGIDVDRTDMAVLMISLN